MAVLDIVRGGLPRKHKGIVVKIVAEDILYRVKDLLFIHACLLLNYNYKSTVSITVFSGVRSAGTV